MNDPFTQPQIPPAQQILQGAGVKTVSSKVFPAEVTDFTPIATQVASTKADVTVSGSVDVPTVSSFVHAFIQQHYNPKIFIATAGPDQGAAFVKAVGKGNENGIFVPNGWYGGFQKADSQQMVKEYIAKYGGTPSDINADVAEAYSVGQVVAQAVAANNSLDQREDHQLSAQRRDSRQRAGRRQVRRAGSEPGWEDTDVPMAEERAGADTADVDAWIQASSEPEAGLGGLGSAGALPRR